METPTVAEAGALIWVDEKRTLCVRGYHPSSVTLCQLCAESVQSGLSEECPGFTSLGVAGSAFVPSVLPFLPLLTVLSGV